MEFLPDQINRSGAQVSSSSSALGKRRRVGLVYDERMCKHSTPKGETHPENPDRIRAVWNKLVTAGIPNRCVVFDAKQVEDKYLSAVHTQSHINLIKTISSKRILQRNNVAAKYDSIYFNKGSSESAYLAVGSVLEAAEKVAKGELNSAFAIVRPPGHHAEKSEPMGFCLFNNVAIATRFLLDQKGLNINKILLVDWDIHHGNGTQKMFYKDPRVLVFSVHRHGHGSFYPTGEDGSHIMTGEGRGAGYNINVPWENGQCGDADYIAVWDHILIPVAKEFNPDIILVSAGFDAAVGDPLGGCRVTPHGFSIMLKKLMEFSRGKIIMALEGGYNLNSLANSVLACVEVLLEDKPVAGSMEEVYPFESTWGVIKAVRDQLREFWPVLAYKLPSNLTSRVTPEVQIYSSHPGNNYDDGLSTSSGDLQEDVTMPLRDLDLSEDSHGECIFPESEEDETDPPSAKMDFSSFLEGGFEDATFVPKVPDGQQVPVADDVDFAAELEVLVGTGDTSCPEHATAVVGQTGVSVASGSRRVVCSIVGGDFRSVSSKRKKSDAPGAKKDEVGNSKPPKIKKPKVLKGIKLTETPGENNYKLCDKSEKSSLGPGKGKGLTALRKLPGYDPALEQKMKEFEKEMEMVDVSSSEEDESVTGGGGFYAPDVKVDDLSDIGPSAKDLEPPEVPDDDSPFTVTLPSVPLKSDLLDGQEKTDYIAGVVMPYRRRDMVGHTNGSFRDYANETVIRMLTVQAENLRRWKLAGDSLSRATRQNHMLRRQLRKYEENSDKMAMERKCEDLRTEILAEQRKNDMVEAALETEKGRYCALESDRDEWKAKFESKHEMVERLMLEITNFSDKEKAFQERIHTLEQEVLHANDEKKKLLEGLPGIVRKLHSSYEFAKEMALVQRKAMLLGAHRNLERLQACNPKLDIKKLEGYRPKAADELKDAGKKFQQKDYPFISSIASGSELSVEELLQVEPAPFPQAAPTSSSVPDGTGTLTS